MEKLQLVRARGARWRVDDVHAYEDCTLVALEGADAATVGLTRRLLLPFDDLDRIARDERSRRVPLRRWRRACRAVLASSVPPGGLGSAVSSRMDILPHQLEPALALVRGGGCRVLLADDVGLGKTIQAGLILAELLARKCVERVLVLTPSGLRTQWCDELWTRFGIAAFNADARALRQLAMTLPLGMNPWAARPIAVGSIDYVKRTDVLAAVATCRWDVLVVDEAHGVGGDSDRRIAVEGLAARASYVVLLSATPHNGDEEAYAKLCATGSFGQDDPLLVFRRTRQIVRPHAVRRVRLLQIRPSRMELRMFAALRRYQRAVRDEHGARALVLSVLSKRAFSTPWALATSVDRRLASIGSVECDARQLVLPLSRLDESDADDEPPPWPSDLALADASRERRLLSAVSRAAGGAILGFESKIGALARFVRRARESAVIFTEYRDTAAHVHSMLGRGRLLHGGLTGAERRAVLVEFEATPGELLIATDAAGQGLNLQRSCRLVINLELPWNPMRLEQRIGRVDRIGQARRVHAVHLVGRATGESDVLMRLDERVRRARIAVGAPDPVRNTPGVLDSSDPEARRAASEEAARVAVCRALTRAGDRDALIDLQTSSWWVARARRRTRAQIGGRAILVYRASAGSSLSTTIATLVIGLAAPVALLGKPQEVSSLKAHVDSWFSRLAELERSFWRRRLDRERAIALAPQPDDPLFQPALFDRRAERERDRSSDQRSDIRASLARRLARAERQATLEDPEVRLLMVLRP